MKPQVAIILGPTASGKTDLSVQIAKHLNTEILSFDSRQFYKEMNIGTAVPSKEELSQVKHHFIQHLSIHDTYNAGKYAEEAEDKLKDVLDRKGTAVMVGGSGLYLEALLFGFDPLPTDENLRNELNQIYEAEGLQVLQELLTKLDPEALESIDHQNPIRVTRAIEIIQLTGKPLNEAQSGRRKEKELFFTPRIFSPVWNRVQLYKRINKRVDLMLENGLEEEVRGLYSNKNLRSLQTVGYTELFDYFDDKISREEAIRLIKRNTRRYAKRQLTWLRKVDDVTYLEQNFFDDFLKKW